MSTEKRSIIDVVCQLEEAIEKDGQMTQSLKDGFTDIRSSFGWQCNGARLLWQKLQYLMVENFPNENPFTPKYQKIFVWKN
jgi:hypothetical protein